MLTCFGSVVFMLVRYSPKLSKYHSRIYSFGYLFPRVRNPYYSYQQEIDELAERNPMKTTDRFEKIYSQGTLNLTEIWVDKETGVQYLFHSGGCGYAGGLTPLLDREGKPVIGPVVNR